MSIFSIIAFIIAAHSAIMILVILLNPTWYEGKAIAAGVTPNITSAIVTKLVIAVVATGLGVYFI